LLPSVDTTGIDEQIWRFHEKAEHGSKQRPLSDVPKTQREASQALSNSFSMCRALV
jgi:hypothetical protein